MILNSNAGINTYYETYGDIKNPPILLLHGIGADNNMWHPQKKILSEKGFYVIVPDLIGHGKSSKQDNITLSDWDNQIIDLLDFIDIERVSIIGVSMGGVIAQHFVVNHENRVKNIIISDSFGELKSFVEKALGFSQVIGFKIFNKLGNKYLVKGMMSTYKADYAVLAKEYFSKVCMEVDLDQMVLARKAINSIDVLNNLKKVQVPSLVMVGTEFGKTFINTNKKIANSLNTKLILIQNSMDPSNLVNSDEFNKNVIEFLNKN